MPPGTDLRQDPGAAEAPRLEVDGAAPALAARAAHHQPVPDLHLMAKEV